MTRKDYWLKLTHHLLCEVKENEELSVGLNGEESTFLRFNNGKLRQATTVDQFTAEIIFQSLSRRTQFQFQLSQCIDHDTHIGIALIKRAREEVQALPDDPHVVPMKNNGQSLTEIKAHLPSANEAIDMIIQAHGKEDFSGFYSGGPIYRASRNSLGQNHWFSNECFFYDYSLFTVTVGTKENKAIKGIYSEKNWHTQSLKTNIQNSINQLSLLKKPSKVLTPGSYRAYLAPSAVAEIAGMFSWGAFSYANFKQGKSPMAKFADGKEGFSSLLSIRENFNLGVSPKFNSLGEVAPEILSVVEQGQLKNWLISSRSAKEYGAESNSAEVAGWAVETFRSLEIAHGDLPEKDVLKKLGTGVYLGNLHYINWSDIPNARVTGMTRYACFWVENGEIAAPIKDMRFDESLFRIFGSQLEALSIEQELNPNTDTYSKRELGGKKIPGALVKDFRFTL